MSFRDDIDAAHARFEVLERENRKLVEENAKLYSIPPPARMRMPADHDALLRRIEDLEQANPRLAAQNERIRKGRTSGPASEAPETAAFTSRRSKTRRARALDKDRSGLLGLAKTILEGVTARYEVVEAENRRLRHSAYSYTRPAPARPPIPNARDAVLARSDKLERDNTKLEADVVKLPADASSPAEPMPAPWPGDFTWGELGFKNPFRKRTP